MFELSSHRNSCVSENSKLTSKKYVSIKEFINERHKTIGKKLYRNSTQLCSNDNNNALYQLVSLIPDEVLYNSTATNLRTFEAAVIFCDISGFTDLSDKYQNVENGASKLSMVLNFYLGIMIQEILSHNGDIIKYSGDAFLAIFRQDKCLSMQNSIQNAIDTSLIIQKNCSNYCTDIGVVLNVKIAISCGEVNFALIGLDSMPANYAIVGSPIWQVKFLQEFISPGDILLAWKGWHYMQQERYIFEMISKNRCFKILGFKQNLSIISQQYEATMNFQEMQNNLIRNMDSSSSIFVESSYEAVTFNTVSTMRQSELFSLRQMHESLKSNETKKNLRRFVIRPLLDAIDMGESIDSLIETRNVVIVFANLITSTSDSKNLLKITDKIYNKLSSIVHAYEGILNKVSLFDKDMMFLSIFGLRGHQHENDSEIGLRCAYELHETFKNWKEVVSNVSIGVTSGKTYCGVIGHDLRREYSVISIAVNLAARLMMAYTDIVSCDQNTLIQSKMNLKHFNQLPKKTLKGIRAYKPAYEFRDIDSDKISFDDSKNEIIYGRNEVFNVVRQNVIAAIENFNSQSSFNSCKAVVIKGDSQQGKSKIINKLYRDYHERGLKCLRLSLNTKHSSMSFFIIKYLSTKIFECDKLEDIVSQKLSHLHIDEYFFVLNKIFNTNFMRAKEFEGICDGMERTLQEMLISLLFMQSINFWIVLIDDADFVDSHSMHLLNSVMKAQTIFFILTIGKQQKKWTLQQNQFYESVTLYCLKPIDKTFQKDIACQSINVSSIPIEYERFLHKNSNGNPGWIENCTKTLLYSGKLKFKSLTVMQSIIDGMMLKNDLVTSNVNENGFFDIIHTNKIDSHEGDRMIDTVVIEDELQESDYIVNYTNNKLMLYDSLSSHDQMVCKCASVLGSEFQRSMLSYLLSNSNLRVGKTIAKLFQLNILYCASTKEKHHAMWAIKNEVISCNCNVDIMESCRDLPKYASCSYLTFDDEKFRKYIYDTLTEKQRLEYHKKSIMYLYRNSKKCSQCGSEIFEIINEIKENSCDGFMKIDFNHDKAKKKLLKESKIKYDYERFKCDEKTKIYPIILNFMSYDYRLCKCETLLYKMLSNIIQHCHGKDNIITKIYSQVMLADFIIKMSNYPRANELLKLTLEEINNVNHLFEDKLLFLTFLRGKISLSLGKCAEGIGQKSNALQYYYDTCKIFKINFPRKFNFIAKIKLFKLIREIKSTKTYCKTSSYTRIQIMIVQESTNVLNQLYEFYLKEHDIQMTKLAAFWSLKQALKCKNNIQSIAKCFKNVLTVSPYDSLNSIDKIIFNEIFKSLRNPDKRSFEEICHLYIAIMEYEIWQNNLNFAIMIGQCAKKISYNTTANRDFFKITPILFIALMKFRRYQDCYKLLQEFQFSIKSDIYALTWYHALKMDLLLDANIECIIDYDTCKKHYITISSTMSNEKNSDAYERFIVNFWVWNLRNGYFEAAQSIMLKVSECSLENGNLIEAFTRLRMIEGLLLQLCYHVRKMNFNEIRFVQNMTRANLKIMKKISNSNICFSSRIKLYSSFFKKLNVRIKNIT